MGGASADTVTDTVPSVSEVSLNDELIELVSLKPVQRPRVRTFWL